MNRALLVLSLLLASGCLDAAETCPNPCDGVCRDLTSDPNHCGACGKACLPGQGCTASTCTCPPSLPSLCGTNCVALASDRANCGECGKTCAAGELCVEGKCALSCPSSLTTCNGTCVDVARDPLHCGECGKPCASGELCVEGKCSLSCPSSLTTCADTCVDLARDPLHCGECGKACLSGELCVEGKCALSCPSSLTTCNGTCVDVARDPLHCGECGKPCAAGELCVESKCSLSCAPSQNVCGLQCVDLQRDPAHCGQCGEVCDPGERCVSGECVVSCPAGQTLCGSQCVDLTRDADHCGRCGRGCTGGATCVAQTCTATACMGEFVFPGARGLVLGYDPGETPYRFLSTMVVGDVNQDGDRDLTFCEGPPGECRVFFGDGAGGFRPAPRRRASDRSGCAEFNCKLTDLDGDSWPDLACTCPGIVSVPVVAVARNLRDGTFAESVRYSVHASDLFPGRVDADAHPDLLVKRPDGTASVLRNDGAGGFLPLQDLPAAMVDEAVDLNGDGFLDLIAFNPSPQLHLEYRLNDGTGSFSPPVSVAGNLTATQHALAWADFTGDGVPDLAVGDGTRLLVFPRQGSGLGAAVETSLASEPKRLVTGDFNGDGKADLFVSESILVGDGTGHFAAAVAPPIANVYSAGDFDRDGWDDLVLFRPFTVDPFIAYATMASIALNDHGGTFGLPPAVSFGTGWAFEVTVGRLDDPLDPLVIVGDWSGEQLLVFGIENGAPRFLRAYPTGFPPVSLAAGDLTGDGLDEVLVGSAQDELLLLTNLGGGQMIPTRVPPSEGQITIKLADMDGDGQLDVVVAEQSNIRILRNDHGVLTPQADLPDSSWVIDVGDVTNDGLPDIIAPSSTGHVWVNTGGFSFLNMPLEYAGAGRDFLFDFDGDGHLDLYGQPIRLGNGDGTFTEGPVLSAPLPGGGIRVDLDGDVRQDLFFAYGVGLARNTGTDLEVRTFTQREPTANAVSADFDRDGRMDTAVLTSRWPESGGNLGLVFLPGRCVRAP